MLSPTPPECGEGVPDGAGRDLNQTMRGVTSLPAYVLTACRALEPGSLGSPRQRQDSTCTHRYNPFARAGFARRAFRATLVRHSYTDRYSI